MIITSPNQCAFSIYFSCDGVWGGIDEQIDDDNIQMIRRKADSYLLQRLCYDSLSGRQANKSYYTYNATLAFTEEEDLLGDATEYDRLMRRLYGEPPTEVCQIDDKNNTASPAAKGASKLSGLLKNMVPYAQFMYHFHDTRPYFTK